MVAVDDAGERVEPVLGGAGGGLPDLALAQLAVAWVLQNPNVSSAIVGASRPEQVTENVKASGVVLEDDLMKKIDEVLSVGEEDEVVYRDPSFNASPSTRDF